MKESYQKCPECKKIYLMNVHKKCPECKVKLKTVKGKKEEPKKENHLGLRVLAFSIDVYGLFLLYTIITYPIFQDNIPTYIALPSGLIIYLVYPLLKDGLLKGQSIGKKIVGLKVVDYETRNPCSYWQSFKRNIVLFIPFVLIIEFGTLLAGNNRRLGDKVGKTEVIRTSPIWKQKKE